MGGSWLVRTVVAADDPRFGPGSLTVDLSTGYQWLDVTLSQNRTIAEVSAQFGVGGDFEGFRYATRDEVITFFQNAGLTGAFGSDRTAVFQALVGVTENNGFPRTVARVSTQLSPGAYYAPDVTPGSVNPGQLLRGGDGTEPQWGSWLVRTVVAADDPRFGPGSRDRPSEHGVSVAGRDVVSEPDDRGGVGTIWGWGRLRGVSLRDPG